MEKYTIYCTTTQVKKAIELGAPIIDNGKSTDVPVMLYNRKGYSIPTAELMIGWLGTQGLSIDVEWSWNGQSTMWVWDNTKKEHVYTSYGNSHKENTLASIDAALEYLIKIKEEKK